MRPIGYIVVAYRYTNPLHYVGLYARDGNRRSLFNDFNSATIFRTRRRASAAIRAAQRYHVNTRAEWKMEYKIVEIQGESL